MTDKYVKVVQDGKDFYHAKDGSVIARAPIANWRDDMLHAAAARKWFEENFCVPQDTTPQYCSKIAVSHPSSAEKLIEAANLLSWEMNETWQEQGTLPAEYHTSLETAFNSVCRCIDLTYGVEYRMDHVLCPKAYD